MKQPLDQFADRIVRNDEIAEFIKGLVEEKDVSPSTILGALSVVCDLSEVLSTAAVRIKGPRT